MTIPFSEPLSIDSLRAGALVLAALGSGNDVLTTKTLRAIRNGVVHSVPGSVAFPGAAFLVSDDLVVVCITGTANVPQFILNFLASLQVSVPGIPGQVAVYFATVALRIFTVADPIIAPLLSSRRLVVLGHSLGGAAAQILGSFWRPFAVSTRVITYGSPRVGDPVFAAAVAPTVYRVEDTIDPVVCLPPEVWIGQGSPWYFPSPPIVKYRHAMGPIKTLYANGASLDVEAHLSIQSAWDQAKSFEFPTHLIDEYLLRLDLALAQSTPDVSFSDPPYLSAVDDFLLKRNVGLPDKGGPMVAALTQGTYFFRTSEASQGWSESWYAQTDPASMLTTLLANLTNRAAFLAGSCQIFALRASTVQPGSPRRSILNRLSTPVNGEATGYYSGVKGATNELMDAIELQVTSVGGNRKISSFRGIADNWVTGTALTGDGVDGLTRMNTYMTGLRTAALGLRVLNRVAPIVPIQQIVRDPTSGLIQVTSPAHGLPGPPAITIVTLRGIKSNPMLNGRWRVGVVDPNVFSLANSGRWFTNAMNDGTWQIFTPGNDVIDTWQFTRCATRKTGVPFGSLRGRRSARLRRR